ncbi:hypothetical protein O9992_20710 [Vibrio lentus]|nr:hypothetical protein [Vibrio lentus]
MKKTHGRLILWWQRPSARQVLLRARKAMPEDVMVSTDIGNK